MRKTILTLLFVTTVIAVIYAANFYWQNLRGALPALRKPSRNITELMEKVATTTTSIGNKRLAENPTEMPLKFPDGFSISIFAKNLPGARVMRFDSFGNMWLSRTSEGAITMLEIENGRVSNQFDIFRNLRKPHGLAFDPERPNLLYLAEENRIKKVITYSDDPGEDIMYLPSGKGHFTRTIEFGQDGKLYISVGSSCNVCDETDERRAAILRYDPKTDKRYEIFAKGLRNAVFFAWHPKTQKMWATEMGRDLIGDDLPPDEINIVDEGGFYGWPWFYGKSIPDTDFKSTSFFHSFDPPAMPIPSFINLQAHSAPLGLAFIPATKDFPEEYWHDLLIAYHGSWNRTKPTGYKIVRFKLDENGNYEGEENFITGWLTPEGEILGRPVDIVIRKSAIYISDDKAGVIYKVTFRD